MTYLDLLRAERDKTLLRPLRSKAAKLPFDIGNSVRLHPATDLFMRGVVWAIVRSIGPKYITIFHPISGTSHKLTFEFARYNLLNDRGRTV